MAFDTIAAATPSWEAAVTIERFARSVMNHYSEEILQPIYTADDAGIVTDQQVLHAEKGSWPYFSAHSDAVNAVLLTPAPDLEAVIAKIELGLGDPALDDDEAAQRMLRILADDIRRIANVGGRA